MLPLRFRFDIPLSREQLTEIQDGDRRHFCAAIPDLELFDVVGLDERGNLALNQKHPLASSAEKVMLTSKDVLPYGQCVYGFIRLTDVPVAYRKAAQGVME